MTRSINAEAAQRLFFTLIPLTAYDCRSCGRDPRILYDAHNQYIIGRDETQGINERGLCAECQSMRDKYAFTKMMAARK